MKIDKDLREIIGALRLILIVGLLFVHYGELPYTGEDPFDGVNRTGNFIPAFVNSFFLFIFLSSVPILSIISGYLIGHRQPDIGGIFNIYKKRFKTVFLPWMIWGGIWVSFAWLLYTVGKPYGMFGFYNIGFEYPYIDLFLNSILGLNKGVFNIQFWFLHDLLLMVLLLPLLVLLVKYKWVFYICVLMISALWLMEIDPALFYNYKVMLYFLVGLYLGCSKIPLLIFQINLRLIVPIFIFLVFLRVLLPLWFNGQMLAEVPVEFLLRLTGVFSIFSLIVNVHQKSPNIIKWLYDKSELSFFIFAFHYPTIVIVKNIFSIGVFSNSVMGLLGVWVMTILTTLLLSIITASFLYKFNKNIFLYLNGHRELQFIKR